MICLRLPALTFVLALLGLMVTACDSQPAASQPVRAAVWLTTADGQTRLAQRASVSFQQGSGTQDLQIYVDTSTRHQPIEGFGAALTHAAAHVIAQSPRRDEIMRRLFSPDEGIGISYVRLAMGASDFVAIPAYTYADVPPGTTDPSLASFSIAPDEVAIIPLLKQARVLNPALQIMASPWSAPAWMKSPAVLNGGRLRPEFYDVYADYFVRFVQAYAAHGLPITAVTVQNEPHHTTDGYPSMRMEAAEQAAFVREALGPAFEAAGIETKILVWDHNWDEPQFPLAVLQDAGARAYVDGVAWHCYAGNVEAQRTVAQAFPDVATYFTECSGGAWDTNFGSVLRWNLQNLFLGAVQRGARTVLLWNLALDENSGPQQGGCTNCRGVVTARTDGTVAYEVEYTLIGHLSQFVRPGAFRIGATTVAGDLETVAFQNPDGSQVLVVFNASSGPRNFDLVSGGAHAAYRGLAPGSVVTFHWPEAAP